ncbi:hypothetical protein JYU34_008642 [Plutella xylostella]|uniref:Uncharacterized protein n=1 Tax=Plutella xylostella TaxID=51655 RepID=A0ABQ7QME7_PLUXY|nr:hypothetical protein JYU34_008642 [Plutella xylostella]
MAPRPPTPPSVSPVSDEPKYLAPALAGIAESLSLLGLTPESLALSVGESLADRYLASLRVRTEPRLPLGGCAPPRAAPPDPALQLFSNDFMNYLNQIA